MPSRICCSQVDIALQQFGRSHFTFDYKEARFAATGCDVDNGRSRETDHRPAHVASEEERIRIDKHRLQSPLRLGEDWKLLRAQLDGLLDDVICRNGDCNRLVPGAFVQLRSEINSMAAIIIIRFQDKM